MHAAFGDIQMTRGDLIAENDQVVVPWEATGTHQGEFVGVAPSGERVTFQGLALLRIKDGKIVDDVSYQNTVEVMLNLEGLEIRPQVSSPWASHQAWQTRLGAYWLGRPGAVSETGSASGFLGVCASH